MDGTKNLDDYDLFNDEPDYGLYLKISNVNGGNPCTRSMRISSGCDDSIAGLSFDIKNISGGRIWLPSSCALTNGDRVKQKKSNKVWGSRYMSAFS